MQKSRELHSGDSVVWVQTSDPRDQEIINRLKNEYGCGPFQVYAMARGAECVHVYLKGQNGLLKTSSGIVTLVLEKFVTHA